MISESVNKLRVVAPAFSCDTSLGDIPEPCPAGAFFWGIFGSAGRGKTSHLLSLLTAKKPNQVYRKVFNNIFWVMPPNSRASIKGDMFKKTDPGKIFDDLTPQVLEHIKSICEAEATEGYTSCLIIDDFASKLKDKGVDRMLKDLIYLRRHIKLSIFILSQSYSQLPLSIRKSLSVFSAFSPANKKEVSSIFEELIFLDKKTAEEVVRFVFKEKHDFLFGNTLTGKLCRNFNPLDITGGEEHKLL